jgi:hypothetical protein
VTRDQLRLQELLKKSCNLDSIENTVTQEDAPGPEDDSLVSKELKKDKNAGRRDSQVFARAATLFGTLYAYDACIAQNFKRQKQVAHITRA